MKSERTMTGILYRRAEKRDRLPLRAPHRLRLPAWRVVTIALLGLPLFLAWGIGRFNLSLPLPPCLFQAVFGFPAPSCGLTRSFLALARGDWQTALEYHLFGPILVGLFGAITAMALIELITQRSLMPLYQRLLGSPPMLALITGFLLYYGLRLWTRYTLPSLPWGLENTALWQHFLAGALAL